MSTNGVDVVSFDLYHSNYSTRTLADHFNECIQFDGGLGREETRKSIHLQLCIISVFN